MNRLPQSPSGRAGFWLVALALTVYLFTAGGSMTTTDAVVAFDVARNIVDDGTVATSGNLLGLEALRGVDGRYYSPFGLLQSIYDVPFYLAGRTFTALGGLQVGKADSIPKAWVALSQTLLGALIVWLVFDLATRVTRSPLAALLAAMTSAFGSVLWPYAQFGFGQPLATATLLAGVRCAMAGIADDSRRQLVWAGVWTGASLLSRHEMGLALLPVGLWIGWAGAGSPSDRIRRLLAFAPGAVAGIGIWLTYNAVRFGSPLDSGHLRDPVPGFGSPIADGLLGLLFSPSASIFLYSPFVAFGFVGLAKLWREDRVSAALPGSLVVMFLLFYATLGNWLGGRSYGSRYLVVALPYLAIGLAAWLNGVRVPRPAFLVLLTIGVVVQIPGVLLDYAKISQEASAERPFSLAERQWSWSAAPLVLNARALGPALSDNIAYVTGRRAPPPFAAPAGDDDRSFSQQFRFSLDLWWLYLFYMGVVSRGVLVLICAGFVGATSYCIVRLHGAAQELPWTSGRQPERAAL